MKRIKTLLWYQLLIAATILSSCNFFGSSSDTIFDLIPIKIGNENSKISIIDKNGLVLLEDEFPTESEIFINDGIIRETTSEDEVKYWKIKDKKIEQVGEEKYNAGTPFFESFAVVRNEVGMLSLIDKEGKQTIPNLSKIGDMNIVRVGIVSDGLIRFKNDEGLWGYIDTEGKIKIKATFRACENFVKGVARVINSDGTFTVIQKDGTSKFSGKEGQSFFPIFDGKIPYREEKGDYWGVINFKGEKIIKDTKYEQIIPLDSKNIIISTGRNEWGVINNSGEYVGDLRAKYEVMPIVSNSGDIIINEDKKVRIYDASGKLIRETDEYKEIFPIGSKRFLAKQKNGKYVILDNEGKELSKDAFIVLNEKLYSTGNSDEAIALQKNNISIESKYFDFEAIFSKVFTNLNQNGIFGVTAQSKIDEILKKFPYNVSGQGSYNVNYDKSDDYNISMTHEKNGEQLSKNYNNQLSDDNTAVAADTTAAIVPAYSSAADYYRSIQTTSNIKDDYKFISTYETSYSPQKRYTLGLGYNITFNFDQPLKQEIQGTDPIFKDQVTTIGYALNTTARIIDIYVRFSFDNIDPKVFWKEFEKKAVEAGFITTAEEKMQNKNNPSRKINFGESSLMFVF